MIQSWIWKFFIQPLLFRFDAETIHKVSCFFIKFGIRLGNIPLVIISGARSSEEEAHLPKVFQIPFQSRVGLAAGFDKNAEILRGLPALGFGFVELGTVTPRPQPGNEFPRLFRDLSREALFNRMGFNSLGAEIVSKRLTAIKPKLPRFFRVGVNLGKNKDTSLEDAHLDYVKAAKPFEGLADYLVINVSSPNTPGLRSLQTLEGLKPIVNSLVDLISKWSFKPPLLLKLAPELSEVDLTQLIQTAESWGIDGWVLTNTLGGTYTYHGQHLQGGWSGKVLTEISKQSLISARKVTKKPLISVGGICTPDDAVERIRSGADLVQIYSGWIFRGPKFPAEVEQYLKTQKPQVFT